MAVTLAEVAERAGVSVASASRALSASRPVTPDVARRVQKAAKDLGYAGNGIARALRTQRTDTVGMVIPSILNPFFTSLVDSMESVLQSEGKQLLLCDSRQDPEREAQHLRSLIERHVDGIVVSPTHEIHSVDAVAQAAMVAPLVQLDRRVDVPGTDWVGLDDHAALGLIVAHLRATGVTKAAFVTSARDNSSTRDRLAGFLAHARAVGIEVRDEWTIFGTYSVTSGEEAATALLAAGHAERPEAIVCADDLIAIGVLRGCRAAGARVPEDIQVTGIDDIEFGRYVEPALTTIRQPMRRMATEALRLLGLRATDQLIDPSSIALTAKLLVRKSTRPLPESAATPLSRG